MKTQKPHVVVASLLVVIAALFVGGTGLWQGRKDHTQSLLAPLLDIGTPDTFIPEGDLDYFAEAAGEHFTFTSNKKLTFRLDEIERSRGGRMEKFQRVTISCPEEEIPELTLTLPFLSLGIMGRKEVTYHITADQRRYQVIVAREDGWYIGEGQYNPRPNGPKFSQRFALRRGSEEEIQTLVDGLPGRLDRHRYTFFD